MRTRRRPAFRLHRPLRDPVDPRTINRKFTDRCIKAGVRHQTVHDARRTCATLLVDLDVPPRHRADAAARDLSVTMEIDARASSAATTDALRRLGDSLE